MTPAQRIITDYCAKKLISKTDIMGHRLFAHLVDHRQAIAQILRERGMSFSQIGVVMNRDHSSIVSLLKRGRK